MPADYVNVNLDANDKEPEFALGTLGSDNGGKDVFEYVRHNEGDGAGAIVAGHLAVGLDAGYPDGEVTNDPNSATIKALLQDPRGFFQRVVTTAYYGWVQCWGMNRQVIITDGSVAQGELLMAHATTTGGVDTHDAAAKTVVGIAKEADGTTSANQLDIGQVKITIRR
jgi:hypothetical protein